MGVERTEQDVSHLERTKRPFLNRLSAGGPAEPAEAEIRELREIAELLGEHRLADRRQPVGPAAIHGGECLDHATLLESSERGIQGSRS